MASKILQWLGNRSIRWLYKKFEVDRVHGIAIVEFSGAPHFGTTMRASLQLIHDYDPIRFRRVQRHIGKIVEGYLLNGQTGEYTVADRVCTIDFQKPDPVNVNNPWYQIFYPAAYASVIVHEATHGELHSRGVGYSPETRARVEKLCYLEQNRFARRVARQARDRSESTLAAIMENMEEEYDAANYEVKWNATKPEQWRSAWKRIKKGLSK